MTDFKNLNFIYDDNDKLLSILLNDKRKLIDFKNCIIKGNSLVFIDNDDFKNIIILTKEQLEHIKIADFVAIVEINNVGEFYFLKAKGKYLAENSNKLQKNTFL